MNEKQMISYYKPFSHNIKFTNVGKHFMKVIKIFTSTF